MALATPAWISGWQAKSMKRWAFSAFLAPFITAQYCDCSMAWFHSMARGAPLSATAWSRPFQMLPSTTSLSASVGEEGELEVDGARVDVGEHARPRELLEVPELRPVPRLLAGGEGLVVVAEDRGEPDVADHVVATGGGVHVVGVGQLPALVVDLVEGALLAERDNAELARVQHVELHAARLVHGEHLAKGGGHLHDLDARGLGEGLEDHLHIGFLVGAADGADDNLAGRAGPARPHERRRCGQTRPRHEAPAGHPARTHLRALRHDIASCARWEPGALNLPHSRVVGIVDGTSLVTRGRFGCRSEPRVSIQSRKRFQ